MLQQRTRRRAQSEKDGQERQHQNRRGSRWVGCSNIHMQSRYSMQRRRRVFWLRVAVDFYLLLSWSRLPQFFVHLFLSRAFFFSAFFFVPVSPHLATTQHKRATIHEHLATHTPIAVASISLLPFWCFSTGPELSTRPQYATITGLRVPYFFCQINGGVPCGLRLIESHRFSFASPT